MWQEKSTHPFCFTCVFLFFGGGGAGRVFWNEASLFMHFSYPFLRQSYWPSGWPYCQLISTKPHKHSVCWLKNTVSLCLSSGSLNRISSQRTSLHSTSLKCLERNICYNIAYRISAAPVGYLKVYAGLLWSSHCMLNHTHDCP